MKELCRNGFKRCNSIQPGTQRRCMLSVVSHRANEEGLDIHRSYGRNRSEQWVDYPCRFNLRVSDEDSTEQVWLGYRPTLIEAQSLAQKLANVLDGATPGAILSATSEREPVECPTNHQETINSQVWKGASDNGYMGYESKQVRYTSPFCPDCGTRLSKGNE